MKGDQPDWEAGFITLWRQLAPDLPEPVRELRFADSMNRKWRFDFGWKDQMLAVEIDGGVGKFTRRGRHLRPGGFQKDAEKLNAAAQLGWCVQRFTGDDMFKRPVQVVEETAKVLRTIIENHREHGEKGG